MRFRLSFDIESKYGIRNISQEVTKWHFMDDTKKSIPFVDLSIKTDTSLFQKIMDCVAQVLESGTYVLGERLTSFEKEISKRLRCEYAIGLNSGTDAIFLTLVALDIGRGDEVILPGNVFSSVPNAVCNAGADPVFCDVRYEDMLIDPKKIKGLISEKTRAILPVHLTGMPCDMDDINRIADEHGITVIEDAAQAIGAFYKGRPAGTLASAGCFSLHPLKNIHALGDGGFVVTNDRDLYQRILRLRNHGLQNNLVESPGYNSRLDEIHAAVARIQLEMLDDIIRRRRAIATRYHSGLEGVVDLNIEPDEKKGVYQLYMIKTPHRDALANYLSAQGIETRVHYRTYVPFHPFYLKRGSGLKDLSVTKRLSSEVLSLPIHEGLTDKQLELIISAVRNYFQK